MPPDRFAAFKEGFAAPWHGLRYMLQHPRLWRYAIWPVLLNLLITGLVAAMLVGFGIWYAAHLHPRFADGGWWRVAEIGVALGLLMLVIGLAVATWLLLQSVLCGYFYSLLAWQVELQLGLPPEALREVSFGKQLADGLFDTCWLLGVNLALLFLHLVPLVGSLFALAGSLYFDCWILGLDYLEYPLALRGWRRDAMRGFGRQHRATTLGLGAAVLLMSLIPIVGAVFLTTAATGAVLLHRRLEA